MFHKYNAHDIAVRYNKNKRMHAPQTQKKKYTRKRKKKKTEGIAKKERASR